MPHVFRPFLVWEGPYVDAWSIAHLMAGVVLAYVLCRLRLGRRQGIAGAVIIGALWEGIEQLIGTRALETNANSVMDVISIAVGYLAGYELFDSALPEKQKRLGLAFAVAVFIIVCALRALGA
jgi:hypothetical protein